MEPVIAFFISDTCTISLSADDSMLFMIWRGTTWHIFIQYLWYNNTTRHLVAKSEEHVAVGRCLHCCRNPTPPKPRCLHLLLPLSFSLLPFLLSLPLTLSLLQGLLAAPDPGADRAAANRQISPDSPACDPVPSADAPPSSFLSLSPSSPFFSLSPSHLSLLQ